ncbi:hypothetical protein [Streptomyces sp. NPDC058424]|uniref:hypothetical protein n=1 Tax=Streptomyces sp. NPDC058424 TaxID=3346491 RepID=UPI00364B8A72
MLASWDGEEHEYVSDTFLAQQSSSGWTTNGIASGGSLPDLNAHSQPWPWLRGSVVQECGRHLDWVTRNGEQQQVCCVELWCSPQVTHARAVTSWGPAEASASSWGLLLFLLPVRERAHVALLDKHGTELASVELYEKGDF